METIKAPQTDAGLLINLTEFLNSERVKAIIAHKDFDACVQAIIDRTDEEEFTFLADWDGDAQYDTGNISRIGILVDVLMGNLGCTVELSEIDTYRPTPHSHLVVTYDSYSDCQTCVFIDGQLVEVDDDGKPVETESDDEEDEFEGETQG